MTALVVPAGTLVTMLAGQIKVGGSVSLTVTVKKQFATPATFEAVQVTVFVPTGNAVGEVITVEPSVHMTVGVGLPVAVGANASVRAHVPDALFVVLFAGQVMVGGVFVVVEFRSEERRVGKECRS